MTMAADIKAALRLDKSQFTRATGEAKGEIVSLKSVAKEVKGELLGAFSGAAIIGFAHHVGQTAKELIGLSNALGLSTDEIQALDNLSKRYGIETTRTRTAVNHLKVALGDAQHGSDQAAAALQRLGVSQEQIARGDIVDVIQTIARNWSLAGNDVGTYSDVQTVLGKTTGELKSVFDDLAKSTLPEISKQFLEAGKSIENGLLVQMVEVDKTLSMATKKLEHWGGTALYVFGKGLAAAAAWVVGDDQADVFEPDQGQTRQTTASERAARNAGAAGTPLAQSQKHQDELMREQFSEDEKRWKQRQDQARRVEVARVRAEKQEQQAADEAQRARDKVRAELASMFTAAQGRITPAAEINRAGAFVGGMRDARAEAAADMVRLQRASNVLLTQLTRELSDIRSRFAISKGQEQV